MDAVVAGTRAPVGNFSGMDFEILGLVGHFSTFDSRKVPYCGGFSHIHLPKAKNSSNLDEFLSRFLLSISVLT